MIVFFALVALLTPNLQAPWGVSMGLKSDALTKVFRPVGQLDRANWVRDRRAQIEVVNFACPSSSGCFSAPSAAQFYFVEGGLAAATLTFRQEQSPEGVNINLLVGATLAAAGFTETVASHSAVGRRTRYLHRGGQTLVWVQDGPDIDLKLYRDDKAPVGRSEAVAAGAQLDLKPYPGAQAYSDAHQAIVARRLPEAEAALGKVLTAPELSPLLRQEASYVLAMVIAAGVKSVVDRDGPVAAKEKKTAEERLNQAQQLAPSLTLHLDGLRKNLSRKSVD